MTSHFIAMLVAASSGAAMAFQGALNAALAKRLGVVGASLVVHAVGLATLVPAQLTIAAVRKTAPLGDFPWYLSLGGVVGAFLIAAVAFAVSSAGTVAATTGIVTAQVLTAAALSHFGLLGLKQVPFTGFKLVGVALIAAGTWIVLRN
ncbi:MAG: DMT family transporter [Bacillota bacterium]